MTKGRQNCGRARLTSPRRYGLPASPSRWPMNICMASAVDLLVGITVY